MLLPTDGLVKAEVRGRKGLETGRMSNDPKNAPNAKPNPRDKKPYEKPSVTSEPIYETVALACGKLPGQGGMCNAAPSAS